MATQVRGVCVAVWVVNGTYSATFPVVALRQYRTPPEYTIQQCGTIVSGTG